MREFDDLMTDVVTLLKADGRMFENIKANVQPGKIFIFDGSIPIEEGDKLVRVLQNELKETYIVIDRGYYSAAHGIEAHYQIKVRKESNLMDMQSGSANINNFYGQVSNAQIQQNTSRSTQTIVYDNTYGKKDELLKFLDVLKENIIQVGLDEKNMLTLKSNIDQIDKELNANAKSSVIKEGLSSIRNILEGTAGSLVASGLLYHIGSLLS